MRLKYSGSCYASEIGSLKHVLFLHKSIARRARANLRSLGGGRGREILKDSDDTIETKSCSRG
jgi:hypothetical protein